MLEQMNSLDGQGLLIIAVGVVLLVAMLSMIVVWQRLKLKEVQQPNYGFLGKRLPAVITTLVLGAGLVGGVYLVNQEDTSIETKATVDIEISYTKELIADNGSTATYLFRATPEVERVAYGPVPGTTFEIFWTFVGPQQLSKSEISRSQNDPSEIQVTLKKGSYDLIILVQYFDDETGEMRSETLKEFVVI